MTVPEQFCNSSIVSVGVIGGSGKFPSPSAIRGLYGGRNELWWLSIVHGDDESNRNDQRFATIDPTDYGCCCEARMWSSSTSSGGRSYEIVSQTRSRFTLTPEGFEGRPFCR